jgi:molybdopterin synthase catalytic subunit
MTVTVRLFAILKERAGRGSIEIDLPDGSTVAEAVAEVGRRTGTTDLLERMPLAHAVNREYVRPQESLRDGDEVALVPPVSGGSTPETSARVHAAITEGEISADRVTALAADPQAGAIVVFHGVTRDVERLEYEAYSEMAEPLLAEILAAVAEQHGLTAIAAEHRIGSVPLTEPSVVIAASAPHRPEAFAGARGAVVRF